ncbi:hypothetical protein [Pandoraea apista]|uniref:hypothetical protein n=1 Tax=Pandoraea apista TaxID=93218 RepID=UPI00248F2EE1|nr:hypothetical protein [Pandoraea apista]
MKLNKPTPFAKGPVEIRRALDLIERAVMGFDRITVWTDHPAPDIPVHLIKQHCRDVTVRNCNSQKFHPLWQTEIYVHQPTRQALVELQSALGAGRRTSIQYAEVAIDWITRDCVAAGFFYDFVLEHLRVPYMRQPVRFEEGTAYFARLAARNGKKVGTNVVMYADEPSKLGAPALVDQPCCHLEYRFHGIETLAQHGLLSLSDCVDFDHHTFWLENLRLYVLAKKVELGRRLAPDGTLVSDVALTKRANTLLDRYRCGDVVVLQDLWCEQPLIAKLVTRIDNSPFIRGVTL